MLLHFSIRNLFTSSCNLLKISEIRNKGTCILTRMLYKIITFIRILNRREVRQMLFAPKEKAQGLVEYALILVLVAVVVIVILALLGPAIGNIFSNIMNAI